MKITAALARLDSEKMALNGTFWHSQGRAPFPKALARLELSLTKPMFGAIFWHSRRRARRYTALLARLSRCRTVVGVDG
jgi:hypothetical protein